MRARSTTFRWSAFTATCASERSAKDYLLATWHQSQRPAQLEFDAGAKWLGLKVRSRKEIDAAHAEVEFVARCREPSGKAQRIHERSRFVKENGRWFYLDGDML